jgi:hypothetical protein
MAICHPLTWRQAAALPWRQYPRRALACGANTVSGAANSAPSGRDRCPFPEPARCRHSPRSSVFRHSCGGRGRVVLISGAVSGCGVPQLMHDGPWP